MSTPRLTRSSSRDREPKSAYPIAVATAGEARYSREECADPGNGVVATFWSSTHGNTEDTPRSAATGSEGLQKLTHQARFVGGTASSCRSLSTSNCWFVSGLPTVT